MRFHRTLFRAGIALGTAFIWIGVYRYFYEISVDTTEAFTRTALLYALSQAVLILLIPFAAKQLAAGLRRSMIIGTSAATVAFLALGAFGGIGNDATLALLFVSFALLSAAYHAFYRMPHRIDTTPSGLMTLHTARKVVVMLAPLAAGIAVEAGIPLPAVLGAAGGILALSLIPLSRVAESYDRYTVGYKETFGRLAAREHRALLLHGVCNGFEGAALLFAWPIVVFLIADRSFAVTGAVFTVSLFLAFVLQHFSKRIMHGLTLPIAMVLAGSVWVIRMVASSPIDIVAVDTYAAAGASPQGAIDRAAFEQHADGGTYFDDYTILKDLGLSFGRLIAALGVAAFASQSSLSFALVALFTAATIASVLGISTALRSGRTIF